MSFKRIRPTASWLEKIIERDYAEVVHHLVMEKFKNKTKESNNTIENDITENESVRSKETPSLLSNKSFAIISFVSGKSPVASEDSDLPISSDEDSAVSIPFSRDLSPTSGSCDNETPFFLTDNEEDDDNGIVYGSLTDMENTIIPSEANFSSPKKTGNLIQVVVGILDAVNGFVVFHDGKKIRVMTCCGEENDHPFYDSEENINEPNKIYNNTSLEEQSKELAREEDEFSLSVSFTDISDLISVSSFKSSSTPSEEDDIDIQLEDKNDENDIVDFKDIQALFKVNKARSHDVNVNTVSAKFGDTKKVEEYVQYEETINKIYAQGRRIKELEILLNVGKRSRGYIGSIPHIIAAKKLLIANLTKRALIVSLANKYYFPPSNRLNCPTGRIIMNNIQCDTNHIGEHGNLPPCYYMVTVQHEATVLHTEITAPDSHGIVEFENHMEFDNVTHDFAIGISLYKLQLKPNYCANSEWKPRLLGKRQIELPQLQLVGQKEISIKSIKNSVFNFGDEILYTNFCTSINTGRKIIQSPITFSSIVRKNSRETKTISEYRWGILDGTDLKLFKGDAEAQYSEPFDVIRMTQCKSCRPYFTPNTLMIDYEKSHCSSIIYLTFDSKTSFREWLSTLNFAILVAKKWDY